MIQGPPLEFGRITIKEDENQTLITYRWFHFSYSVYLITGLASLFSVYKMLSLGHLFDRGLIAMMLPPTTLFLGLLASYYSLAGILNTTRIIAQEGKLEINSQPIPWKRDRPQLITDIVKIYNSESTTRLNFEPPRIYPILALTDSGSVKTILGQTFSEVEAIYICEKLNNRLGLENKPYLESMLDKLYEPDQKLNPSFTGTRKYPVSPSEMARTMQSMVERSQLIYRRTTQDSHITYDVLDLYWGTGDSYMLTQVLINADPDGSEIALKQKPKPFMFGTIGYTFKVRSFFSKIESEREFLQYQFHKEPPDNRSA